MIKERIIQLIEFKGLGKEDFYSRIGMTSASFRGKAKLTPINSTAIANILSEISDVNPNWLLTGEGYMIKEEQEVGVRSLVQNRKTTDPLIEEQEVPLYDISAVAGLKGLFDTNVPSEILDTIKIPGLPKCDGAITITGDSMYPLLKSGDMVLYAITRKEHIFYGEMYLMSIQLDQWEEYITVKYIQVSEIEGHVKLVSQNTHHGPKDIPMSSIRSIALVKASIRINSII